MHLRVCLIGCLSAWAIWTGGGTAAQRYMSIDEVREGMVGVGRTVFQGSTLEDFTVHILGVLRNNIGPRRDLILARLDGGPLAKAGVIAGMSGSPVYIDGRLVGAVSYSLGSFPTEPIAGITPIGEMLDATRADGNTGVRPTPIPVDAAPMAFLEAVQSAIRPPLPFASPGTSVVRLTPDGFDARLAAELRPIATPLSFGSSEGPLADVVSTTLVPAGFVAVPQAAVAPPRPTDVGELRPGDPVGVALVTGDLSVAATGTVTHVDGPRVHAFGHAFFNLGTSRLPMTRAYVHTILPSLMSSTKVASTGDIIGTIVQDRVTGIAGRLGDAPVTIPLTVKLRTERGVSQQIDLALAEHPLLTPLFAFASLLNAFGSYEREMGAATYTVRARLAIRGRGTIAYQDVLTGDSAATAAASTVAVPLGALMTSDIEPIQVERIEVDVETAERPALATIERAWLDSADVRPGRQVPLKILLRTWRGDDLVQTVPIDIPADASGPLTLLVADAQRLTQWEQRDIRPPAPPTSVDQLLTQLRRVRRNHVLYVRLHTPGAGAVVNGEALPHLPSSVLTVLGGDRSGGGGQPTTAAIVGSWDIPLAHAVSGARTLPVQIRQNGRRP